MSRRARRPPKERPPAPDDPDAPWRLFLALPLAAAARAAVADTVAALSAEPWPVRWVAAEGAHVTLHFLGDQPRERAELLRLALPAVVGTHAAFALRTGDVGVFPSIRRPRVLWLGLHGPVHKLETLHAAIGQRLRALDFPVDDEPWHPHVTLGRVRDEGTPEVPLRSLPAAIRHRLANPATGVLAGPPPSPVPVTAIELVRSHLSHAGARYEMVARFPLGRSEERRQ